MSHKKKMGKSLRTDRETDMLYDYYANEEKFNEQLLGEFNERKEKRQIPNNLSEKSEKIQEGGFTDSDDTEDTDTDDTDDSDASNEQSENISESSAKSPYGKKVESVKKPMSEVRPRSEARPRSDSKIKSDAKSRSDKKNEYIEDMMGVLETPEERRARARELYWKLEDIKTKGAVLTRVYSLDDDPDEMQIEYDMHYERRNKTNQVKLYKNILLNIVAGVEFLNEKYDPFDFKLRHWSKQVATDMDDYTEVLEELYEKYKSKGGSMPPEIRLLFMIIMSGVTYHLSQALFGSGGLNETIKNNPNIINKFLGQMVGGKTGNAPAPSATSREEILARLKARNTAQATSTSQTAPTGSVANNTDEPTITRPSQREIDLEREKAKLEQERQVMIENMRRQQAIHSHQLETLRKEAEYRQRQQQYHPQPPQPSPSVKSDTKKSKTATILEELNDDDIFEPNTQTQTQTKTETKKPQPTSFELDSMLDTLDEDSDNLDISDFKSPSEKKKFNKNSSQSATKSTNRSASKNIRTDNKSESNRKKGVLKL